MKKYLLVFNRYLLYIITFFLPWQIKYIFKEVSFNEVNSIYYEFAVFGIDLLIILSFIFTVFLLFLNKFDNKNKTKYTENNKNKENVLDNNGLKGKNLSTLLKTNIVIKKIKVDKIILLFFLFFLVFNFIINYRFDNFSFYANSLLIYRILISFCYLYALLKNNIKLNIFFIIVCTQAALQGLFSYFQFITQNFILPNSKWLGISAQYPYNLGTCVVIAKKMRMLRSYAFFSHPNILGGYLGLCLNIACYNYLETKKKLLSLSKNDYNIAEEKKYKKKIILWLVLIIFIFTGLIFTFSRSAILATFTSLMVLLFSLFLKHKKNIKLFFKHTITLNILFSLIFILFGFLYKEFFYQRFISNNYIESLSLVHRAQLRDIFKIIINKNWLYGVGFNNYVYYIFSYINNTFNGYYYQPVHNTYYLLWAETGIMFWFTILYVIFLFFYKKLYKKIIDAFKNNKPIILSLILLLYIAVICFWDHYFYSLHIGNLLIIVVLFIFIKQMQE